MYHQSLYQETQLPLELIKMVEDYVPPHEDLAFVRARTENESLRLLKLYGAAYGNKILRAKYQAEHLEHCAEYCKAVLENNKREEIEEFKNENSETKREIVAAIMSRYEDLTKSVLKHLKKRHDVKKDYETRIRYNDCCGWLPIRASGGVIEWLDWIVSCDD